MGRNQAARARERKRKERLAAEQHELQHQQQAVQLQATQAGQAQVDLLSALPDVGQGTVAAADEAAAADPHASAPSIGEQTEAKIAATSAAAANPVTLEAIVEDDSDRDSEGHSNNGDAQLFGASVGPSDCNELQDPWAPIQGQMQTIGATATKAPNAPSQGASPSFRPAFMATSVWERYHKLHELFYSLPAEAQGSRDAKNVVDELFELFSHVRSLVEQ